MDLSIIIPLYNENESIITLSHEIETVCKKISKVRLYLLMMVVQTIG